VWTYPDGARQRERRAQTAGREIARLMSFRNTLGVIKHDIKRKVTRTTITQAVGFRARRLIVFLTPGYDGPSGGVMSIAAIYRETQALQKLHEAKVALCTVPGEPPLLKYTWFRNRNYLLDFEALLSRCGKLDYLLIHIPEYAVNHLSEWLDSHWSSFQAIKECHFNVLVQNIDLTEGQDFTALKRFGKVTATTAHEAYSNAATRERLGVSLHRLSCCNGPELYTLSGYTTKQPLLMVSHDEHPLKEKVLGEIKQALPTLRIQVIQNLAYEDYCKVASSTKWSLTFGEGLDGYFSDPVFSGGVAFAVFNERYFTPAFASLETVYPSWDVLREKMTTDLQRLDEPIAYERCSREAWSLLNDLYSTARFRENLRSFYRGEYTFP
jgi:hypothetical protein